MLWGGKRVVARVLTFNFKGSTITDAQKRGLTYLPGYKGILLDKNLIEEEIMKTSDDILESLPKYIDRSKRGLNLPLEVGSFLTPSENDSYLIEERNVRMASNIQAYLDSDLIKGTPLIILGSAHNSGIVDLLNQEGYKNCHF